MQFTFPSNQFFTIGFKIAFLLIKSQWQTHSKIKQIYANSTAAANLDFRLCYKQHTYISVTTHDTNVLIRLQSYTCPECSHEDKEFHFLYWQG